MNIIILSILLTLAYSIILPKYYYAEINTIYNDHTTSIKLYHEPYRSLLKITEPIEYNLSICEHGNETISRYNNITCHIECLNGFNYRNNKILCGSCSSYNLFYWLSISNRSERCDKSNGISYKYYIESSSYIEYCFNDNIPIYIKILNMDNNIIMIYINTWNPQLTKFNDNIYNLPKICIN